MSFGKSSSFLKNKSILFSLFYITGLTSVAIASETRINTLQAIGGIQDEVDVFTYTGRIAHYNLALIELGTSSNSNAWAAAMNTDSSKISFGAAVNRHDWQSSYGLSSESVFMLNRFLYSAISDSTTGADDAKFVRGDRAMDMLLGMSLNSTDTIGVRTSIAREKTKTSSSATDSSAEQSAASTEVAFGFTRKTNMSIDLNLALMTSEKFVNSKVTAGSKTGVEVNASHTRIDGRWLESINSSGIYADTTIATRSAKAKITTANLEKSGSFKEQAIKFGAGYAMIVPDRQANLFAGANLTKTNSKGPTASGNAATFASSLSSSDKSVKIDAQWLEANLAGEGKFSDNYGAMFGTNYTVWGNIVAKDEINQTKTETEITAPSNSGLWSLGLFWANNSARIDASFSKSFLHNGPHFIAGNTTDPMLTRISARVNF